MHDGDILILRERDVRSILTARELEIVETVRAAYETHAKGDSSLPHSVFLRFPGDQRNRIIALPSYLGGEYGIAGVKWVSSFPGNLELGLDRASAVVILNSPTTGRTKAILEGSLVSAKRTAASAALAALSIHGGERISRVGVIGCGVINFEIMRFLLAVLPEERKFLVFDIDQRRANQFAERCRGEFDDIEVDVAGHISMVLGRCPLISLATTATEPHIFDLSDCARGSTILHISLRDLSPEVILSCDNIVDDIDHVCRADTSIHLAEQRFNHRDFINCTLADILLGKARSRSDPDRVAVFSPFGLGVLDIALSKLVYESAISENRGMVIKSFHQEEESNPRPDGKGPQK